MKKVFFILNPVSGAVKKDNILLQIKDFIDRDKFELETVFTEGPGHATDLCKEQVGKGTEIIVAVGGDGSVNEVAHGMVGSESVLGIIPAGSGNGLAHHLKIPTVYRKAIDLINREKTIKIDTGFINDKLFVSIAGIGFDGLIAKKFSGNSRRGFLSYLKFVTEEYPSYRPRKYRIEMNGEKRETKALFITFANSDQFGYNTSIAPDAKVDDGLLDVCIMQKPPIIEIPLLASLLYWRQIDKSKYIEIFKTDQLTVRTRKKRWVNVDGEPYKLGKELKVKINPQSLNIIVP
jgi:YegS/Rv2252/BmrU family lipid kinase